MTTDSSVGVVNQTTGLVSPVDTSTITNDEGTIVQRQRMAIGDPTYPDNLAPVDRYDGLGIKILDGGDLQLCLDMILRELRMTRQVICEMAKVNYKP